MNRFWIIFLLLLLDISCVTAQKKLNSGISFSLGTEYIPEDDNLLLRELTFTSKPNFGVQIGYERRLGDNFSVEIDASYLIAKSKIETYFRDDQGNPILGYQNTTIKRFNLQALLQLWVVERKKYSFTPGISMAFGQAFSSNFRYENENGELIFPEQKESFGINYVNASIALRNRFLLTRLRSERKGTFGALHLILTPSLIYTLNTTAEIPEWLEHEPPSWGASLWLGLQYAF